MHMRTLRSSPRSRMHSILFYSALIPVPAPLFFSPLWSLYNLAFGLWWAMGDVYSALTVSTRAHGVSSVSVEHLPSFLSVGHAHSPRARMLFLSLLLPIASLSNLYVRLPAPNTKPADSDSFSLTVTVPRLFVFVFSSLWALALALTLVPGSVWAPTPMPTPVLCLPELNLNAKLKLRLYVRSGPGKATVPGLLSSVPYGRGFFVGVAWIKILFVGAGAETLLCLVLILCLVPYTLAGANTFLSLVYARMRTLSIPVPVSARPSLFSVGGCPALTTNRICAWFPTHPCRCRCRLSRFCAPGTSARASGC
ncbi:hypothetical protein B0H13DRAFT_2343432 [Mycena leptocephala]|nr:hypothetical protein B0H13DRAFT_2343432 [Mycena leptocephala]